MNKVYWELRLTKVIFMILSNFNDNSDSYVASRLRGQSFLSYV